MTDLVERLRAKDAPSISMLMEEAADEIERLRSLCDSLADDRKRHLHEIERLRKDKLAWHMVVADKQNEIEWLRAVVNRIIEDLEISVFCDGHTRLQPCEPECHCVQHYDAVRELIR